MSDINLLPENLRGKERDLQASGGGVPASPRVYSTPRTPNLAAASDPSAPSPKSSGTSWWQWLLGKFKGEGTPKIVSATSLKPLASAIPSPPLPKIDLINTSTVEVTPPPITLALLPEFKRSSISPSVAPYTTPIIPVKPTPLITKPQNSFKPALEVKPVPVPPASSLSPFHLKINNEPTRQVNISVPKDSVVPKKELPLPVVPSSELGVNLIPVDVGSKQPRLVVQELVWAGVASLVVVGLAYWGVIRYRDTRFLQSETAGQQAIKLQNELEGAKQVLETSGALTKRMNVIFQLLQTRSSLLPLFTWLEKNTSTVVSYNSLAADENGQITLAGSAPTLTDMAKQMKVFENSPEVLKFELGSWKVSNPEPASAVKDERTVVVKPEVTFTFSLKVKTSLFLPAMPKDDTDESAEDTP